MEYRTGERESDPSVWIIGDTVLMDGVETCLRDLDLKHLVRWNEIDADFDANLKEYCPCLIIFELETSGSHRLLNLLIRKPGVYLIGIDLECNQVLVVNSLQMETRKMTDLYQIVREVTGAAN
jgi:hypothetical protein